ncbi:class I SAM-dependent methyltransferase [Sediminibacterium sp.]|uniref:class I SAM-dependent methyltransferase n=1 Tax=Sediminibacterium sp. TaxID=1917865 RepID=UPI003F6F1FB4
MFTPLHYYTCPSCNSDKIQYKLTAKDHTVSKENFDIWHCSQCDLQFTQDVPTIDQIGPYYHSENYISHSNTKKGFINQLYHIVRNYTLGSKARLVKRYTGKSTGRLLDIGAGVGAFAATMKAQGWDTTALEPDSSARAEAKNQYGIDLLLPNELYSFEPEYFDVITLWHVLEHVHDLQGYWKIFNQILPVGGKLVIAVPNYTSVDARYYGAFWAAYDVPRHLYHFSPASIAQLAGIHGFNVIATQPMWFDSFYVSMLSEQYQHGVSRYLAAFWQGLKSNLAALNNRNRCSSVIYILQKN